MGDRLVFIPCRLDRRDAKTALIDDADGWPRRVVGPLGRVAGQLVVATRWVRAANGRHLAWFGDGSRLWVTYGPGRPEEDFVPLAPPPVTPRSVASAGREHRPGQERDFQLRRPAVYPPGVAE